MTGPELQDFLVTLLVRRHGSTRKRWRVAVGPVQVHDLRTHAHCNWSVHPGGDTRENAAIEHLLDSIRLEHPIVTQD